jgi:transcriptional regulator with XRE-family HTH domain
MTLREARQRRHLTQEALAELSGIEQATISALETGRVQSPAWDTVARLSRVLKIRPEELFPVGESKAVAS